MKSETESIMKEIINCPNIDEYFKQKVNNCYEIISFQKVIGKNDFQIPEPWNGDIENAKILVISSLNPGYSSEENYPIYKWDFENMKDFFTNRFKNEKYTKHFQPVSRNGGLLSRPKYWQEVNGLIRKLLGNGFNLSNSPVAITEMVHCKYKKWSDLNSKKNILNECCSKYLDKIISICGNLRVLIGYGDAVEKYLKNRYNIKGKENVAQVPIENRDVYLVFLKQPGSNKIRIIEKVISSEMLQKIRNYCKDS